MILDENLFQDYRKPLKEYKSIKESGESLKEGRSIEDIDREILRLLESTSLSVYISRYYEFETSESGLQRFLNIYAPDDMDSFEFNSIRRDVRRVLGNRGVYWNSDDGLIIVDVTSFYKESDAGEEESLTESEESSSEFYGVFEKGGSIGKSYATRDDLQVWSGRDAGTLVKVFSSSDEAKNYAKRMRSMLSPGERSYYGMGYFVKKLSKKNLEHPQVIDMISNMPGLSASQVNKESLHESKSEFTEGIDGWDNRTGVIKRIDKYLRDNPEAAPPKGYIQKGSRAYDNAVNRYGNYVTTPFGNISTEDLMQYARENKLLSEASYGMIKEKFKNKYLNESISLSDDQLDKAMELIDEIYDACKSIYSYNENGKFEEGLNLNEWSIYSAAADLHDILESGSLTESVETDETPWSYKEVEDTLKNLSNNWKDKSGVCRCYYKEEKQHAVKILRKHYKIVETSQDGDWTVIAFETPIQKESI